MNETLSDDSSAASSGDEMLNMRVSFLSQESGKGRGKGSDREESEDGERMPVKLPGNKRKRESAADSVSGDETEKGDKAREKARRAFKEEFSQKIGAPDKLFWHEKSIKGKKMTYPVRVVLREEVVGIALKEWNDETHSPIHFLQYPRGGKGQYDIASHRSLSPYHGKGEKDRWCPVKVKQYAKQLKKKLRLDATNLRIEEAFLICALHKSLAEGEQAERLKSVDEAVPEEVSTNPKAEEAADSESSEEEEATRGARRTPRRHTSAQERRETLRPGDHIEYYAQQSTAGDERGRCTAEILYIDPKGNRGQPLLTIDDPMTTLQPDHHVRRVKRKRYGKLLDNDGVFRAIEEYVLKREGDPDAHAKMMARKNAATKDFVRRRKEETLANMEKDGFNSSLAKDALRM